MLIRCFIKSYVPTIIQFQTRQSCIVQCLRSFSVVVVFDGCGDGVAVVGKGIVLMYRIINNICPDYLKKTMSHILLTYHVDILDLLTVTNYIRQNLTANFSASHSCTLDLPSGILSPYMLKMQLRLTLLNVYI